MNSRFPNAGRWLALGALALVLGQMIRLVLLAPLDPSFERDAIVATACALLLLAITLRSSASSPSTSYLLGSAIGLLFFASILGIDRANPTYVSWLMYGDWAQHYLGWEMFRHEGLNWPPGRINGLWHPVGTSIVFTDSLPLLALPLSLVSDWLPAQFQYIGAFLAMSFVLQGAFAARLAQNAGLGVAGQLLVALLLVNAPFLHARVNHDTLTAHWLLLACLLLATSSNARRAPLAWYAIIALSALIHPYFVAMCGPMAGAALWWQLRESPQRVAVHGVAGAALALSLLWASGAFIIPSQPSLTSTVAYGHYSANLLTFVTPMYRSGWLPEWQMATEGQYEGYAYLGGGVLLMLLIAAVLTALRRTRDTQVRFIPGRVWLAASALALFGASTVLSIGEFKLIDLPQNGGLFGMFRSSGRFVWALAYTLMIGAVIALSARLGPHRATGVLLLVSVLQVLDLSSAQGQFAAQRNAHREQPWQTPLTDAAWDELAAARQHLVFMPPPACGVVPAGWVEFQRLAARHGMTFNAGFLARHDGQASEAHCHVLAEQMRHGTLPRNALYVVNPEWKQRLLSGLPAKTECAILNELEACYVPESGAVEVDR